MKRVIEKKMLTKLFWSTIKDIIVFFPESSEERQDSCDSSESSEDSELESLSFLF